MYSALIELADETLAANRRVRAHSEHLRAQTTALLFTYRLHRFSPIFGASDAGDDGHARRLLRDFCAVVEPPKSYAGLSRGSVCQACGKTIDPGDLEYDIAATESEIRLDADCYRVFSEELRAASEAGAPDVEGA